MALLPFVFFYWQMPFSSSLTIGNDYPMFPVPQQLELNFSRAMGSFPLYAPGFAGGQSASALTLGQVFHPLAHVAAAMPGYWHGDALDWNTFWRLVSLAFVHYVLFAFLRRLQLSVGIAFIISAITVYNLRMLDMFRYGASLESYTGHLLLCAAVCWHWLEPERWLPKAGIVGAAYWSVTSGHPQMMYYGLLGAGVVTLVAPFAMRHVLHDEPVAPKRALSFYLRVGACTGLGLVLSLAYVLPYYFDFLAANAERVGQDYAWADGYRDTFLGTLDNFFLPQFSGVVGAFGGSALVLLPAIIPLLLLARVRVPPVAWVIWIVVVLVFLHMQGERTPVHFLAWNYLPLASAFRVAGRASLVLPFLFLLVLAWLVRLPPRTLRLGGREVLLAPGSLLAALGFVATVVFGLLPDRLTQDPSRYTPVNLHDIPEGAQLLAFVAGLVALAALAAALWPRPAAETAPDAGKGGKGKRARRARKKKRKKELDWRFVALVVVAAVTCVQLLVHLRYGTWVQPKRDTPTLAQVKAQKRERLDYRQNAGRGLYTDVVLRQIERSVLEPFLGKVYRDHEVADDNDDAYVRMSRGRAPDVVVVEGPLEAKPPVRQTVAAGEDRVRLVYSSFNRLTFEVVAGEVSFFGFGMPYSSRWAATVGGESVPVYRANGGAHAVVVPQGESRVDFRYSSPAAFWGTLLSFACLAALAAWSCHSHLAARRRRIWIAVSVALPLLLFVNWWHGLHHGDNLQTQFEWSSEGVPAAPNVAFGRPTAMSSIPYGAHRRHQYGSGKGVDGLRAAGSGFLTRKQSAPWWTVDLGEPRYLARIVLHDGRGGDEVNVRPLTIEASSDGERWSVIGTVGRPSAGDPIRITPPPGTNGRHVRVRASGSSYLGLDEVEIFESPGG
jgi:hypothetical protein